MFYKRLLHLAILNIKKSHFCQQKALLVYLKLRNFVNERWSRHGKILKKSNIKNI